MSSRALRRQLNRVKDQLDVIGLDAKDILEKDDLRMFTLAQTIIQQLAFKLSEPRGTLMQVQGREVLAELNRRFQ
jgi:hypothetical protein